MEYEEIVQRFAPLIGSRTWRLNHLYWIETKDAEAKVQRFVMNYAQNCLNSGLHYKMAILKARQMGVSTYIALLMLDSMLFNDNFHAGAIDKTKPDAFKKVGKMRFAWERLDFVPPNASEDDLALAALGRWIKERTGVFTAGKWKPVIDKAGCLAFANGSDVEAGMDMRGGTVDFLHLSEFGYIARHSPEKARKILSGAFEAVPLGGFIVNESTHEGGKTGLNYDIMKEAMDKMGQRLSPMDWKFFFFPWFRDEAYRLKGADYMTIPFEANEYFKRLEKEYKVEIDVEKRRWYVSKKAGMRDGVMEQEYPSVPEEALTPHVRGAIYGDLMRERRAKGCVGTSFAYDPEFPIYTSWDIGGSDATAIWAVQFVGLEVRWLRFYQGAGREFGWYANVIKRWMKELDCEFDEHFLPHDGSRKGVYTESPAEMLMSAGLHNVTVVPRITDVWVGISYVRSKLKNSVFHEETTKPIVTDDGRELMGGTDCLASYYKETVVEDGVSKDMPVHDAACHGCDGARTICEAEKKGMVRMTGGYQGRGARTGRSIW